MFSREIKEKACSLQMSEFLKLQPDKFMWFCYNRTQFNSARGKTMPKDDTLILKTAQMKIPTLNSTNNSFLATLST